MSQTPAVLRQLASRLANPDPGRGAQQADAFVAGGSAVSRWQPTTGTQYVTGVGHDDCSYLDLNAVAKQLGAVRAPQRPVGDALRRHR